MANIKRANTSGITKTGTAVPDIVDAPTIGTATVATGQSYTGSANVSVPFTPATTGGAASSYLVTSSSGNTNTGASSPITVSDTVGTARTYTVKGVNSSGTWVASAASNAVTPSSVPQAPTIGTATAGAAGTGQASVTFTAGATGGSAITGYTATSSPGSITGTNSASPITISGLTMGTAYTFTVTSTNANGTSSASSASNSVTPLDATFMASISYSGGTMQNHVLTVDSSDNVIVGYALNPANVSSAYWYNIIHKLSSSGSLTWTNTSSYYYASSTAGQAFPYDVTTDSSNNIYFTGTQYSIDGTFQTTNWSNVAKLDSSNGNFLWQTVLYKYNIGGSPNASYGAGLVLDSSNNTYMVGSLDYDIDNGDMSIAKLNSSGTYQWSIQYQRPTPQGSGEYFNSIALDSSSNLYAVGLYSTQTLISKGNYAYTSTVVVQKTDISGTQIWAKGFSDYNKTYSNPQGKSIVVDSSSNVYAVGATTLNNSYQAFVAKWNSSGTLQWQKLLNDPANGATFAQSVAIDSSANIYVAISASSSPSYSTIVKYNSSGTIQWQRKLIVSAKDTWPGRISVSGNNLILTGRYVNDVTNNYYGTYIIKVPTDGSKTGTYSVGSLSYVYSSGSLSEYTGNMGEVSPGLTATSRTLSTQSGTLSSRTATLSTTTVSV